MCKQCPSKVSKTGTLCKECQLVPYYKARRKLLDKLENNEALTEHESKLEQMLKKKGMI